MSLSQRTEMRRCGKRYGTEEMALHSKRGRSGDYLAVPCADELCASWHLRSRPAPVVAARTAQADTGPSRRVRLLVLVRDGYACARCGRPCGPGIFRYSLQHRKARGVGGDSSPANLVLLCGTAVDLCHGEVESRHFPEDAERGYRLESWQDPLAEGVMYHEADGSGVTRWLESDGGVLSESPAAVTR